MRLVTSRVIEGLQDHYSWGQSHPLLCIPSPLDPVPDPWLSAFGRDVEIGPWSQLDQGAWQRLADACA